VVDDTDDSAYTVQDERGNGTDARTGRKIDTVELLLDGRQVCTNDGRKRPTAKISTAVPLPKTARTAD